MRSRLSAGTSLLLCLLFLQLTSKLLTAVESAAPAPNSDPVYQQLRNVSLGNEAVTVSNVDLKRDAGTFHLRSGMVCFLAPVQGKVTGAVFMGDGNFVLEPPTSSEKRSLALLTREKEFSEVFSQMALRFTDNTYEELKKAGVSASTGCDTGAFQDSQRELRKKLHYNLTGRILQDVLSTEPGGLFIAFIHGKHYSDRMVYSIDAHGASPLIYPLSPEEVQLVTYDDSKTGVWAAFHLASEYANGAASSGEKNAYIHIEHQTLDTTIEKNANLIGKATTTLVSQANGLRVVPFRLFGSLRVQGVSTETGQPLNFIQEDKKEDPDFFVILPQPLASGEKLTLVTTYGGKEAVSNEGGQNYYPIARADWYPNNAADGLGEYTTYDLTFRIPKGMKMAATGNLVSESAEGDQSVTVWKSAVPLTVAGFNFGKFKAEEGKLEKPPVTVNAYANQELPDRVRNLLASVQGTDLEGQRTRFGLPTGRPDVALGTMTTTGMVKKALAEGQLATEIFSDYFGPTSYSRLTLTQQTAFNFGQSWPGLVWLPISYFYDSTVRHELGMDDARGYFKVVAPHEVAHQWWGHTVGFNSYRDQWMSEGFADMSASLYLQNIYNKEPQRFLKFWADERELLLERNKEGFRAIDAGPLTMGYRLSNSREGYDITRRLIYPKGAYVLHMIRMMMMDRKSGDQLFKETMQDFVRTYANHAATTEDFKAVVEKHMTPEMDLDGNHRLDWFFNQYVYGTALPTYKLDYSFENAPDGVLFNLKITQSNVDEHFKMLVPIYLEMADGRLLSLGRARVLGNTTLEQKVPLKGLKQAPKRAIVNYYYDVLAASN
jgi:Peptidase family M1 domain